MAVVEMYEKEGWPSVSPPSVAFGRFDPWVVEEVVWEEMAAVGGCGRGRVSCVSSLCDTWSFSPLLSLSILSW